MYASFISLAIGFIALVTGRQVYWLCSGGVTLVTIFILSPLVSDLQQTNELLVTAALGGICVGLFTALFGRPMMIAAAFLAGGYLAVMLPVQLGLGLAWLNWVVYLMGGLFAMVNALIWFDTVIIILSALVGSSLILNTLDLGDFDRLIAFSGISIFGIAVQTILMRYYPEEIAG